MDEADKTGGAGSSRPISPDEQSQLPHITTKTTRLYRRAPYGRKQYFTPEDAQSAQYYILNPVPQKHANTWRPRLYRGDHPKYDDGSELIARARRGGAWGKFQIEIGDGVKQKAENEARECRRKNYLLLNKVRKIFCLRPKQPSRPLEDPTPVTGRIDVVRVVRAGLFTRSLKFELLGKTFIWTGTRRFLPDQVHAIKGIAHDVKLSDNDGNLIATFEKDRWISFKISEKTGERVNKNRSCLGDLCFHPASQIGVPDVQMEQGELQMMEDIFTFTAWIILESEHRFRYRGLDLLAEIAESIGG